MVASLTTGAGQIFAGRYGAGRVTLLLFDGEGRLSNVVQGIQERDTLKAMFTTLVA